jgi:hypothetical protein
MVDHVLIALQRCSIDLRVSLNLRLIDQDYLGELWTWRA